MSRSGGLSSALHQRLALDLRVATCSAPRYLVFRLEREVEKDRKVWGSKCDLPLRRELEDMRARATEGQIQEEKMKGLVACAKKQIKHGIFHLSSRHWKREVTWVEDSLVLPSFLPFPNSSSISHFHSLAPSSYGLLLGYTLFSSWCRRECCNSTQLWHYPVILVNRFLWLSRI